MHEWNDKILKTKLEAPNLLRKEVDLRFKDLNQKIDILKLLKDKVIHGESIPSNWEELYEFKVKLEQPVVTTYQDRLNEDEDVKR